MGRIGSKAEFERIRHEIITSRDTGTVRIAVSSGTCGRAYGSEKVVESLRRELSLRGLDGEVELKSTGCHGFCEQEPIVLVFPMEVAYCRVKPEDAAEIVAETVSKGNVIDRLLYTDPVTGEKVVRESDIPFYRNQRRIVLASNRIIDPLKIEDYIAVGGYSALVKALTEMKPEQIIDDIKRANLRGRGGGGFPAGYKWEACRNAPGDRRYVICNADEGDPGAYMDRSVLEGNPHSVIEGMLIGAYAIGSDEGYIYVRNEYPLALANLRVALRQAEEYGLLGDNILGTGFSFRIKISRGGGAYVCGESTALMASIEGGVGEPRAKHIHTSVKGLYDRPTNLNNVETWANVPIIIDRGVDWFTSIGNEDSKGTKIFSLVGKVNNTGLVEVPMGISLRQVIYDIGGGIRSGKKFKAVQTGGPSGGCIPEEYLDTPVDFDRLTELGSMMGSGGMIVMDEDNCMVDVAKYFMNFLKDESCGKCTTCREGTRRMHEVLEAITRGEGKDGDIELLEELAWITQNGSLCALGSTAANPVLTTLQYFRSEYEAHIAQKRCPAKVCKGLIRYTIDQTKCNGCGRCQRECPERAVEGEIRTPMRINPDLCSRCGICKDLCQFDAVIVE